MSTYKSFAVIGAGIIGGPIANALAAEGANVVVITRPSSSSAKSLAAGVKVAPAELSDAAALAAIFTAHGVEVVVSTVPLAGLPFQSVFSDAAKKAGVKLFVPSEFGFSTIGLEGAEGELSLKAKFGKYLEEIGLPSLRIFTGLFITALPWLTGAGSGKFEIAGAGDKKASFTDPADIASFTAYVLTHLPPSELANKAFRIEGESASFLDIAGYYGSKVTVEHVGGFPGDEFRTFLQKLINSGNGALGDDPAGLSNGLYAGHSFKGIKEGLGL